MILRVLIEGRPPAGCLRQTALTARNAMLLALACYGTVLPLHANDSPVETYDLNHRWEYTWSDLHLTGEVPDARKDSSGGPVTWSAWNAEKVKAERNGRQILWLRCHLPESSLRDPALFFDSIDLNFRLYGEDGLRHTYGAYNADGTILFQGWPWHMVRLARTDPGHFVYLRVESDYRDIGIWQRTLLGERAALLGDLGVSSLDRLILSVVFSSTGMVSLLLFGLQRRWKEAFHFGCISLLSAISFAADPGDFVRLMVWNRPDVWMRIEYAAGFLAIGFYGLFFGIIFPRRIYRLFFHGASLIFFAVAIGATLLGMLDLRWLINANLVANVFVIPTITIFLLILVRERRQPDVIFLLIGFAIQGLTAFIDISKSFGIISNDLRLAKYGYSGFLLFMVFLVSSRLVRINHLLEDYSHNLEKREIELKRNNTRLEEINRLKNEFLSRLSLEFRLPIAAILNLTGSLMQRSGYDDRDRRYLDYIHRSSDRMEKLVESIQTLSRLQNRDLDLNRQPVDAVAVLKHAGQIFLSYTQDAPLEIQKTGALPPAFADPLRLQQIFLDILGYLFSWNPHASLSIQITESPAKENESEPWLNFCFTKAATLPEDRRSLAFEPFLSIPDPSLPVPVPTLSAARQLANLHGGSLHLAEESGSTICILELPAGDRPPATAMELPGRGELEKELTDMLDAVPARPSETNLLLLGKLQKANSGLLLVESDPAQLLALFTRLEDEGYSVTGVASGTQGFELIQKKAFNLVLVSSYLSDMSGLEFGQMVREHFSLVDLPLLVISEPSAPLSSGSTRIFNDHILRPVNSSEMISRIELHLSLARSMHDHLRLLEIQRDLRLVQAIQERLLPEKKPLSDFFQLATIYVPAESVSGDIYDFYQIDDHQLCLFLADVTGHGLAAAMLASMVKVAFVVNHDLLSRPEAALQSMNRLMLSLFTNQLFTASLLCLDFEKRTFRYARAGHPPLYVFRRDTGAIEELLPRGRVMGIEENLNIEVRDGTFTAGDRFFLYTDGVTEMRDGNGGYFDLLHFIRERPNGNVDNLSQELLEQLLGKNQQDGRPEDDITSLILEIKTADGGKHH